MHTPFFTLLRGGRAFFSGLEGPVDILIAGEKIAAVGKDIDIRGIECARFDLRGHTLTPGLVDSHVHLIGGGGEGGPANRTPEALLSSIVSAGTTTVVGCLGTDGVTRHLESLLAKCRGLTAEGITAYMYSGAYAVPTPTLTGSVERDIILIDRVLGTGEIALSDHRSSQPTQQQIAALAAESRRGGILSGKAGVVNIHMGDGGKGLGMLFDLIAETETPVTQFIPTHVNRSASLFTESLQWASIGGFIDITASIGRQEGSSALNPDEAVRRALENDVPLTRLLMSSDGNGSLPEFDSQGNLLRLTVAPLTTLFAAVRSMVDAQGISLETAMQIVSANPARVLKLWPKKGSLLLGSDADILVLDEGLEIDHVWARGRHMVAEKKVCIKGTFEL